VCYRREATMVVGCVVLGYCGGVAGEGRDGDRIWWCSIIVVMLYERGDDGGRGSCAHI
jgi:hypothetical protein